MAQGASLELPMSTFPKVDTQYGTEVTHPEQLFFQSFEEAFDTAVAFGVEAGRGRNPTLIWIDPVKFPLRFSNAPPSMCWIQGAAGMIRDGGSL